MLARLGNVIYWTFCGLAAAFAVLCVAVITTAAGEPDYLFFIVLLAVASVVSWLLGRAVLYVLAGR